MAHRIRPAQASDSTQAAEVVRAVFEEYGFTWDAEDYNADLYDLEGHYLSRGFPFWVAEDPSGKVVATCALELFDRVPGEFGGTVFHEGKVRIAASDCSLERLYVHPGSRNEGLGSRLFEMTVAEALKQSRSVMEIWSDKKLTLAHRLYGRYGSLKAGDRICDDPDKSPEWGFALDLQGARTRK
jgi:GNAT superfamily N-acetyltransferase